MFRDMDMAVHEGWRQGDVAYEGATRQGRDEYDPEHDRMEPPPSCTIVTGPICIRDVCDYFESLRS